MIVMRARSITRELEGVGSENYVFGPLNGNERKLFRAQMALLRSFPFEGPKKSRFSGPPAPFQLPLYWMVPHRLHTEQSDRFLAYIPS
jgi:hypothetical protein